jgi:hypothetical protein
MGEYFKESMMISGSCEVAGQSVEYKARIVNNSIGIPEDVLKSHVLDALTPFWIEKFERSVFTYTTEIGSKLSHYVVLSSVGGAGVHFDVSLIVCVIENESALSEVAGSIWSWGGLSKTNVSSD